MKLDKNLVEQHNEGLFAKHKKKLANFLEDNEGADKHIQKLKDFQIAIPSWALGTGGTRFGRFNGGGEPSNLEEKWKILFIAPIEPV